MTTSIMGTVKDQYGPGPGPENEDDQGHTLKSKLICINLGNQNLFLSLF